MDPADPPTDEQYQAMLNRTERLAAEFTESRQFETLTRHQQREAAFVIEGVGELLAAYEGVSIDDPDTRSLEAVCTQLYPAKISAEPDHFGAVAPVLAAFLRFLDDRGDLDDAEPLATAVEQLGDDIVEAAADPDNWGMAKSLLESGEIDADALREDIEEGGGGIHRLDLSEDVESGPLDTADPTTGPPSPTDPGGGPIPGLDQLDTAHVSEFSPEEREALIEAFDSISEESDAVLRTAATALFDPATERDPAAVFETTDLTPREMENALDEVLEVAGVEMPERRGDPDDLSVLDPEQVERFFDWYGRLLVYVNDRFDVVPEIDSYDEFVTAYLDETYPIREHLFEECDTAAVIADFVVENPADLPDAALSQIESWKDYETGEFVIVEHRETDTIFLDPDTPQAFAVTALESSYAETVPEAQLPAAVDDIVLLPFEGTIVTDPWVRIVPLSLLVGRQTGVDIDAAYEEAKHRFGIVESLPAGEELERTDAEKLRFYTKNKGNRERFTEEIEQLKDETDELARIYHEQLGKANARRLGREFRELGLEEAYVGIYDGQVVATAPTEAQLQEMLSAIMPDGKADHPYVYHYDPG